MVGRKALKVKPDGKTSAATAALLVSVRHGWLGRLTATTTLMVPALLIAGLVAVFLDVSDRETLMLRLAFGIVFLASVPMTILAALIMMSPILDDNSRDGQLAGGITWVIVQVIAVALLLSSVDLPRTHIPVGVFDASLTVSFPVLAIVLGYFVLGTAIPYLVGGKRAKVFRAQLVEEEERIKDHLYKLLLIPRAKTYAPMLTQLRNTVEARISELKDEYFYLNPLTPPQEEMTIASAASVDTGEIMALGAGRRQERRSLEAIDVGLVEQAAPMPAEPGANKRDRSRLLPPVNEPSVATDDERVVETTAVEWLPGTPGPFAVDAAVVSAEQPTYGKIADEVAERRGWAHHDPRRLQLRVLTHSLESEARVADPAFIHCSFLERVHGRIGEILDDLERRGDDAAKEAAAHHWSDVAKAQDMGARANRRTQRRPAQGCCSVHGCRRRRRHRLGEGDGFRSVAGLKRQLMPRHGPFVRRH